MLFQETRLPGVFIIDLERIEDERGFFARTWCGPYCRGSLRANKPAGKARRLLCTPSRDTRQYVSRQELELYRSDCCGRICPNASRFEKCCSDWDAILAKHEKDALHPVRSTALATKWRARYNNVFKYWKSSVRRFGLLPREP